MGQVFGHEMKILVLQLKETTYTEPELVGSKKIDELKWGKEYDIFIKESHKYETDKAKVFAIIYERCDEAMKNRLQSTTEYKAADENSDVVKLLEMIKGVAFDASGKSYPAKQATDAWKQLILINQQLEESLSAYYERFVSLVDVVERSYGPIEPTAMVGAAKQQQMTNATRCLLTCSCKEHTKGLDF